MSLPLTPYLHPGSVRTDLRAASRDAVIAELAAPLLADLDRNLAAAALQVLFDREKLGSTGIGEEVAIPHGKVAGFPEVRLALGLHRGGVDFSAVDGRPVRIVFLLLAPEGVAAATHLQLLARIARLVRRPAVRSALLAAADDAALLRAATAADAEERE